MALQSPERRFLVAPAKGFDEIEPADPYRLLQSKMFVGDTLAPRFHMRPQACLTWGHQLANKYIPIPSVEICARYRLEARPS